VADDAQAPRRRTPRRDRDPSAASASSGAGEPAPDAIEASPDVDDVGPEVRLEGDASAPSDEGDRAATGAGQAAAASAEGDRAATGAGQAPAPSAEGDPTGPSADERESAEGRSESAEGALGDASATDDPVSAEIDEDAPLASARGTHPSDVDATDTIDLVGSDDTGAATEPGGGEVEATSEPSASTATVETVEPEARVEAIAVADPGSPAHPAESEARIEAAEPAAAASLWESDEGGPTASLPWLQARSPDDRICPFLRAVTADDHLAFPIESPDPANRCASMHEAVPQSLRQQELVCLTANHTNCPRYLRGAALTGSGLPEAVEPHVRPRAVMTPAISAALIILALSFGASVVFGVANGGLAMPSPAAVITAGPSATTAAVAETSRPTSAPTPRATASVVVSAEPSASASAQPSASASASTAPSPTPIATPRPTAVAAGTTPAPRSTRYKLLKPCPNKPNCWIYTVRAGDNLFSIAKYFGVPLSTVKRLNPWTRTQSLRAGKQLILPPPTR
jgi:LysM repeat protein